MTVRPTWVGTSWKMNKTIPEAVEYVESLLGRAALAVDDGQLVPFVIPPVTALSAVRAAVGSGRHLRIGAQNAHWEESGAWTGEVSMGQVLDAGADLVEIGHSERRRHFGETDRIVALKVRAALRHGLTPVVCVGDEAEDRDAGRSTDRVLAQTSAALEGVEDPGGVVLAYEPVWAIGEGGTAADPEEVATVVAEVRARHGQDPPILYGGSVSRRNAEEVLDVPGVDGIFVGRAAWSVDGFADLLELAAGRRRRRCG